MAICNVEERNEGRKGRGIAIRWTYKRDDKYIHATRIIEINKWAGGRKNGGDGTVLT
jgi:hypothetical protein